MNDTFRLRVRPWGPNVIIWPACGKALVNWLRPQSRNEICYRILRQWIFLYRITTDEEFVDAMQFFEMVYVHFADADPLHYEAVTSLLSRHSTVLWVKRYEQIYGYETASQRHRHSAPSGAGWRHIFSLFPSPNSTTQPYCTNFFCNVDWCTVFSKFFYLTTL